MSLRLYKVLKYIQYGPQGGIQKGRKKLVRKYHGIPEIGRIKFINVPSWEEL